MRAGTCLNLFPSSSCVSLFQRDACRCAVSAVSTASCVSVPSPELVKVPNLSILVRVLTSNSEKSYSSRSKSTHLLLGVRVKSKQLKYTKKYSYHRPKIITPARLQHVTISQAFLLVNVLDINKIGFLSTEFLPGAITCKRH